MDFTGFAFAANSSPQCKLGTYIAFPSTGKDYKVFWFPGRNREEVNSSGAGFSLWGLDAPRLIALNQPPQAEACATGGRGYRFFLFRGTNQRLKLY
jgi:hypothetical protein